MHPPRSRWSAVAEAEKEPGAGGEVVGAGDGEAEGVRHPVDGVEQPADVDGIPGGGVGHSGPAQGVGVGGADLAWVEREFLQKPERGAGAVADRGGAPVVEDRPGEAGVKGSRRDRAVGAGSERGCPTYPRLQL